MSNTPIRRITIGNVAKLVRAQLKQFLPDQKFSIRSRSSPHPSLTITWSGGPSVKMVKTLTWHFVGAVNDLDSWVYKPSQWREETVQFECVHISYKRTR